MNRSHLNQLFVVTNHIAVGICMAVLALLLGSIVWQGFSAIGIDFLITEARNFGAGGGIVYQILGTVLLGITTALICFPLALGAAIFRSEYLGNTKLGTLAEILIYGLNGVPSILFGIFGLIFFVNILGTGISWFVGAIILAMMILPTVMLATYQSLHSVPEIYRQTALSFGFDRWQVITKVLLPRAVTGAVTGLLLGLARAVGETAPIMFVATAFSGVTLPDSLFEPVSTLPTHILALAHQATNPEALQNAWGASLVLLCIVLVFSVSALFLRLNLSAADSQ